MLQHCINHISKTTSLYFTFSVLVIYAHLMQCLKCNKSELHLSGMIWEMPWLHHSNIMNGSTLQWQFSDGLKSQGGLHNALLAGLLLYVNKICPWSRSSLFTPVAVQDLSIRLMGMRKILRVENRKGIFDCVLISASSHFYTQNLRAMMHNILSSKEKKWKSYW